MRVDRTQTEGYEKFRAAWTYPDGAAWKAVGTIAFPVANGCYVVHAKLALRCRTTNNGAVLHRAVGLTVTDDTGAGRFANVTGLLGAPFTPGSTVADFSDLAAADVRFTPTVVGATVNVLVEAQWPGLVGGQTLDVSSDVWWE
jgi:hypothetical protein